MSVGEEDAMGMVSVRWPWLRVYGCCCFYVRDCLICSSLGDARKELLIIQAAETLEKDCVAYRDLMTFNNLDPPCPAFLSTPAVCAEVWGAILSPSWGGS